MLNSKNSIFLLNVPFLLCVSLFILSCTKGQNIAFEVEKKPLIFAKAQNEKLTVREGEPLEIHFKLLEKANHEAHFTYTIVPSDGTAMESTGTFSIFKIFEEEKTEKPARFENMTGNFTIAEETDEGSFTITPLKNKIYGPDEVFDIIVEEPGSPENKVLVTVQDADGIPEIILPKTYVVKGEEAQVQINLSHASAYPTELTLDFSNTLLGSAVPDKDFFLPSETVVTIPAEALSTTVPLKTNKSLHTAGDKEFFIKHTLSSYSHGTFPEANNNSHLIIIDSEAIQKVSTSDMRVLENSGQAPLLLYLNAPLTQDVLVDLSIVNVTAFPGTDYAKIQLHDVKIPKGQSSVKFNIPIVKDNAAEPDKVFQVFMSNARGASLDQNHYQSTITITESESSLTPEKPLNVIPLITTSSANPTSSATLDYMIQFDHSISDFHLEDLVITNGTASDIGLVRDLTTNEMTTYSFKITAIKDGPISVYLSSNKVKDEFMQDNNVASNQVDVVYDISKIDAKLTFLPKILNQPQKISVNFSKKITGFTSSDIQVENARISQILNSKYQPNLTDPEDTFYLTIDSNTSGFELSKPYSVSVAMDSVVDYLGNKNHASNVLKRSYDTKAPSLVIYADKKSVKAGETLEISFILSEEATLSGGVTNGFSPKNIFVTNGKLESFNPFCEGAVCKATYTPDLNLQGANAIISTGGSYKDDSGNDGQQADPLTLKIDTVIPSAVLSTNAVNLKKGDKAQITVTLSEKSPDFSLKSLQFLNGTFTPTEPFCTDLVCRGAFTPTADFEGMSQINFLTNIAYTDESGNLGTYGKSLSFKVDMKPPTVELSPSSYSLKIGDTSTIKFTLSETVGSYVGAFSKINLRTSTGGTLTPHSPFCLDRVCEADFKPADNYQGAVTVSTGGDFTDPAGNLGVQAKPVQITVDTLPPTPTITVLSSTTGFANVSPIKFAINFNEPLTSGPKVSDFLISNYAGTPTIEGSGKTYTMSIVPQKVGTVELSLPAGKVSDNFNNPNLISNKATVVYDNLPPQLSSMKAATTRLNLKIPSTKITLNFTKPMSTTGDNAGLALTNFADSNSAGTFSNLTCNNNVCEVLYTANEGYMGVTTLTLVNAFKDSFGNIGKNMSLPLVIDDIDLKVPKVTLSMSPAVSLLQYGIKPTLTLSFNKIPQNFDAAKSMVLPYGTLSAFTISEDKLTYTATYSAEEGTNRSMFGITVKPGSFTDNHQNSGIAANTITLSTVGVKHMIANCTGATQNYKNGNYHYCIWGDAGSWANAFNIIELGNQGRMVRVTVIGGGAGGSNRSCLKDSWFTGGSGGGGGGIATHSGFIINEPGPHAVAVGEGGLGGFSITQTENFGKDSHFDNKIKAFGGRGVTAGKAEGGTANLNGGVGGLPGGHNEMNQCGTPAADGGAGPCFTEPHWNTKKCIYSGGGGGGASAGFYGAASSDREWIGGNCSKGGNGGTGGGGAGGDYAALGDIEASKHMTESSSPGAGGGGSLAYFNPEGTGCVNLFNGTAGYKGLVIISYRFQ